MLRIALRTAIFTGFAALATLAARKVAEGVWRLATGEDPPEER